MNSKLRSLLWLGLGLALATGASGAVGRQSPQVKTWAQLAPAMTMAQVRTVLEPAHGAPLIVIRSRDGRFEVWTYDRGAQLLFVRGSLQYWTAAKTSPTA